MLFESKAHSPFLSEVGAVSLEGGTPTYLCPSTCGHVQQKAPRKQYCARGGTNK